MGSKYDDLVFEIAQEMAEHGEWEAVDSWGNGQVVLTDSESVAFAKWVADKIADAWDKGHTEGWYDGLYTDPENGRPDNNPYKMEE